MENQISDAVVTVNNEAYGIVPNTLSFNEGLGEQMILAVSDGGGRVSQVYANNVETNFGSVVFQLRSTARNIQAARSWKVNGNTNVVIIAGEDSNGNDFIRTFTQAAMTGTYDVQIQAEGTIEIAFNSNAAT